MDYSNIFNESTNKIRSFPDFPKEQTEALWRSLPKCSPYIAALIYLLPYGDRYQEEQITFAETLTILTLSAFVHDDVTKNRGFNRKEAVLYGDYLFALAFTLLPDTLSVEDGQRVAERAGRYNEQRLRHQTADDVSPETRLAFAKEDYGALLKDIAEEAMAKNDFNDGIKEQYGQCAETLGTLWGLRCEKDTVNGDALLKQAKTEMDGLPKEIAVELAQLWKELKGASLGNEPQHTATEK